MKYVIHWLYTSRKGLTPCDVAACYISSISFKPSTVSTFQGARSVDTSTFLLHHGCHDKLPDLGLLVRCYLRQVLRRRTLILHQILFKPLGVQLYFTCIIYMAMAVEKQASIVRFLIRFQLRGRFLISLVLIFKKGSLPLSFLSYILNILNILNLLYGGECLTGN